MNGADVIAIIILIAIVIAIIVYLLHWLYRRSTKDVSFVRTGFGGEKVVMGGGALVLPIVHDVTQVSMNTLRLEVNRARERSLITKDRMRVEVSVEFNVRVIPTMEAVGMAARTLGRRTMNPDQLKDLVQGRFVDAMAAAAAEMTLEHIHENRGAYVKAVRERVKGTLDPNGLELESVSLTNLDQTDIQLFNPANTFDTEGLTRLTEQIESRKKLRNDIEQDTMIDIKNKNLEAEKRALDIDRDSEYARLEQEREISVRRAQQKAEVARERAERDREIEEVQIRSREEVEKTRILQEQAIDAARIKREQDVEALEVQRRKAIELEEQERAIAIALKSKDQSVAQAAAEEARAKTVEATEKVSTARELEAAERRRLVDIIEAKQRAEREAIQALKAAEVEKKAAAEKAEASKLQSMAAKFRYEVDAEGRRQLNEAENLRSDASRRSSLREKLVEKLDSIIRESVKPMDNIESIKILQVDGMPGFSGTSGAASANASAAGPSPSGDAGNGSLSDRVVSSALRYRAHAPFVDGLLQEIGMSTSDITSLGKLLSADDVAPAPFGTGPGSGSEETKSKRDRRSRSE